MLLCAACPGVCATGACGVSCAGALQQVLEPVANAFSSQVPNIKLRNGSDLFGGSRSFFNLVASGAADKACGVIPFPTYTPPMFSAGLVRGAPQDNVCLNADRQSCQIAPCCWLFSIDGCW